MHEIQFNSNRIFSLWFRGGGGGRTWMPVLDFIINVIIVCGKYFGVCDRHDSIWNIQANSIQCKSLICPTRSYTCVWYSIHIECEEHCTKSIVFNIIRKSGEALCLLGSIQLHRNVRVCSFDCLYHIWYVVHYAFME